MSECERGVGSIQNLECDFVMFVILVFIQFTTNHFSFIIVLVQFSKNFNIGLSSIFISFLDFSLAVTLYKEYFKYKYAYVTGDVILIHKIF